MACSATGRDDDATTRRCARYSFTVRNRSSLLRPLLGGAAVLAVAAVRPS
ncbi:hypothetical protein SLI_7887 [Streptomyces lividans 1326]|uniref:Uncharacterized protein n=1 Tax=Streptomyces lividans 1326 TaxID=1200984 RepID=A0A7U9HH69_STRLI|nr:hypothetical protein SLI_7887 [Streptomyces lividans 1326]